MNTVQILKDARALISDEKNWVKGAYRKNIDGRECFCALGAVFKVSASEDVFFQDQLKAENALALAAGTSWVPEFNDAHTHAEVLTLFDRAIAHAESEAVQ